MGRLKVGKRKMDLTFWGFAKAGIFSTKLH